MPLSATHQSPQPPQAIPHLSTPGVHVTLSAQVRIIRGRHQMRVVNERGWFWALRGCGSRSLALHSTAAAEREVCRFAVAEIEDATAKDFYEQLWDASIDAVVR